MQTTLNYFISVYILTFILCSSLFCISSFTLSLYRQIICNVSTSVVFTSIHSLFPPCLLDYISIFHQNITFSQDSLWSLLRVRFGLAFMRLVYVFITYNYYMISNYRNYVMYVLLFSLSYDMELYLYFFYLSRDLDDCLHFKEVNLAARSPLELTSFRHDYSFQIAITSMWLFTSYCISLFAVICHSYFILCLYDHSTYTGLSFVALVCDYDFPPHMMFCSFYGLWSFILNFLHSLWCHVLIHLLQGLHLL